MKCLLCDRPFTQNANSEISLESVKVFQYPEAIKEILEKLIFLDKNNPVRLGRALGYLDELCGKMALKDKPGDIIPFRKG